MLYGNLTADPEMIPTKKGGNFSTFSVATNNNWKNKDGELVSTTDFHKIVAFGKLGEITGAHLHKGSPILVSGRLRNRSYVSKEGSKRYVTEVILEDFNFMPGGRKAEETGAAKSETDGELVAAA